MTFARFITDFADQAVLLPLAVGIALLFALTGWWRGALAWSAGVGGVMGCMLLLKLIAIACAACWFGPGFTSPSGHAAAGTAVYGGVLGLSLRRRGSVAGPFIGAVLVAGALGLSRLVLQVHSVPEVLAGGGVGTLGAVGFVLGAGPFPARVRSWHLLALGAVAAVALHGVHLPAEASIRQAALDWFPFCRQCR